MSDDLPTQIELIGQLSDAQDDLVTRSLTAWRVGELFVHTISDGTKIPFLLDAQLDENGKARGVDIATGEFIETGKPLKFLAKDLTPIENNSKLRKAIKTALDLFALGNPNPKMRRDAVIKLGQAQNADYLPYFQKHLAAEKIPR